MKKNRKSKYLFFISIGIAVFFIVLFTNAYVIKSDNIIFGIIQELITMPILLAQLFFFGLSVKYCISDKFAPRQYSFWAFFTLLTTNIITFGSLFFSKFS